MLGRAEGEPHTGSRAAFAGGLVTVAVGAAVTSFLDAVLARGAAELSDSIIRALFLADIMGIAGIMLPMALLTFASAAVIWKTSVLWRWLAFIATGASLFLTAGAAFPLEGPAGTLFGLRFVGLILFLAFVLLSSINMLTPSASRQHQPAPSYPAVPDDQRLGRIVKEVAQQQLPHGEEVSKEQRRRRRRQ
ncbi:MAG: hypothetical protein ACRDN9_03460 [Streptosporangiaceae bacterium]